MKNEIVLFTDGDINIEVELSPELETVWLTQKQMGELFEVKQATLSEHINNIISYLFIRNNIYLLKIIRSKKTSQRAGLILYNIQTLFYCYMEYLTSSAS